ncbi:hypothetical protein [Alkaliphilus sp. B6464]|uniref:hypothetical protein n=1 Tax=Alkaliphilus sp. B6464 TaxID=2731219 RepID=UPI001BA87454|nr:hypothetical protein [Alkaliphilus sp. B6464]
MIIADKPTRNLDIDTEQSVYEKYGSNIVYLAPIYDFNKQIGAIKITYIVNNFYKKYSVLK